MYVSAPLLGAKVFVGRFQAWASQIFVYILCVYLLEEHVEDLDGWIGDWVYQNLFSFLFHSDTARLPSFQSDVYDAPVLG
ncbi:hypothetical protein C0Q61_15375 [Streptomyces albidoflavus]|nr:hypothetical protein C0Q61_15375 [Streptomyces albidoflavus]